MKPSKCEFSGIVFGIILLLGLSISLNLFQYYSEPAAVYISVPGECPPPECPPLECPPSTPTPVVAPANTSTLIYVDSFEGGTLYKTKDGKFNVLDLHGSYREMGRQYGHLLKDEMNSMYAEITADLARRGMGEAEQTDSAYTLYNPYPDRSKEIILGMSETSGLTLEEQIRLNGAVFNLFEVYFFHATPGDPTAGCSGTAFWGDYSKDGKLYFGRNWDASQDMMGPYMKYLTLAVYHPEGSGNTVANLEYAGEVYTETAMNDKGIFLELNNGGQSDPAYYPGRIDPAQVLFTFMFDYSTMGEIDAAFNTTLAGAAYVVQAADSSAAYSYEWATFGVRRRSENVSGLLVTYNSFVPPYPEGWAVEPPLPLDTRRDNLLLLANSPEYKGHMDVEKYKQFLSVRWEDGGAFADGTNFQVIAIPEDRALWIRAIGHSEDWAEIDLRPLFEG